MFLLSILIPGALCQSPSFETFMNPVIPGDHPDPTLFRYGRHFFTTGSSFNTSPIIYHSTDLVHWEISSRPVDPGWSELDDCPACGIWGGSMAYFAGSFWDYFALKGAMWYVKSGTPFGPWGTPVRVNPPASATNGLGTDNSIFVDDDGTAYLLAKPGQSRNQIFKLNADGQCTGEKIDLGWINPAPDYPLSWAEGPVMCKREGYYYYFVAGNAAGGQYAFRSQTLTSEQSAWEFLGEVLKTDDRDGSLFYGPNHSSYPVELDDGTWWSIIQSYEFTWSDNEWQGQGGRQGLLSRVTWDNNGRPALSWPVNYPVQAPLLNGSGIPWMVPKSDFFNTDNLHAGWQFLGRTPASVYSLTERPGWFRMKPGSMLKSIVKNDAERAYSLITRIDFNPVNTGEEAGIRITNGLVDEQNLNVRLYSSYNGERQVVCFAFEDTYYESVNDVGNVLWLKLVRSEHKLTGYYSSDGSDWVQTGVAIDVSAMDKSQPDNNGWIGNRQGLYAKNRSADFDLYIYRDAYTPIQAFCTANQRGTSKSDAIDGTRVLGEIENLDWAMYAGIEFGNEETNRIPGQFNIHAAAQGPGGTVEIWLDSINTGLKLGECLVSNTGSWDIFAPFSIPILPTNGRHDVYLQFKGTEGSELFRIKTFEFVSKEFSYYEFAQLDSANTLRLKLTIPVVLPDSVTGIEVKVNGQPVDIAHYAVQAEDPEWIWITLKNKVNNTDTVTISYSEGNLRTADSAYLIPFADQFVDNLLPGSAPRLVYARTNRAGSLIELGFNKEMTVSDSLDKAFLVLIEKGESDTTGINSVTSKPGDPFTLLLEPENSLYADYEIKIMIEGNLLTSVDGGVLPEVPGFEVDNFSYGSPPEIISSSVLPGGLIFSVEFSKVLQEASGQIPYFSFRVNGESYPLNNIVFRQSRLDFTTEIPIRYGDELWLSYNGSELIAPDSGVLEVFSDFLLNNTLSIPDYTELPGTLEAEAYVTNLGGIVSNSTDGVAQKMVTLNNNEFLDFAVDVKEPGLYTLGLRVTTQDNDMVALLQKPGIESRDLDTIPVYSNGDYQIWKTMYSLTLLDSGLQYFRLLTQQGEYQINWLRFEPGNTIPLASIDTIVLKENGESITIKYNKELKIPTDERSRFTVLADGEPYSLDRLYLNNANKSILNLSLSNAIPETIENITLSYTGGGLTAADNSPLASFEYVLRDKTNSSIFLNRDEKNLRIYPNPAMQNITIESGSDFNQIEITDISGRRLLIKKSYTFDHRVSLDLDLIPGIYFLKLSGIKGQSVRSFIIE